MPRRAFAIVLAGFLTVSIAYAIRYGYGMLLPEMLPALGITKTQAGAIFAVYFGVYTLATPVLGILSDRFDYRFILTFFTLLLGCGAMAMALADSLWKACLFFSVAGLGHAACWAPVTALVQKWVPENRRGVALSFVTMGVGLGIPLWGISMPYIVAAAGWRAGWIGMGLVGVGVGILNFVLVRNPEKSEKGDAAALPPTQPWRSAYQGILRSRIFWVIGTAYLLVGFNVLIPFAFLPVYARESLGLPYTTATRFVAIIALCGIAGQLTLGTLSDAIGRVRVMKVCGTIMGVACLGMALSQNPWALYGCTGIYGLGYGAVWPVYAAAARDFFGAGKTGGVVGLWTCLLGLGSVISPVVCGWTIDRTGGYTWALMLGLFSGLLSTLVLLGMGKHPE